MFFFFRNICSRHCIDRYLIPGYHAVNFLYQSLAEIIEPICNPEDCPKDKDRLLLFIRKQPVIIFPFRRTSAPVGKRDKADYSTLGQVNREGLCREDDPGAFQVMPLLPVYPADIMEHPRTFEKEAILWAQLVQGLEIVKEYEREACHGGAVRQSFGIDRCECSNCSPEILFPERVFRPVPFLPSRNKCPVELVP